MTKIAIIEDDQAISQMYRIKFEAEGYEVETAEDGKLGFELAEHMKPALIMLALMMPLMNGSEMRGRLRKTSGGHHITVIVLTNKGEQEIPPKVRELGVSAIILKADMTPRQVAELVKSKLGA